MIVFFSRFHFYTRNCFFMFRLVHDIIVDDSPTSSQGSDDRILRNSCSGRPTDSDDEDIGVLRRNGNRSGHTSGDDSEDLDQHPSIVADSDFR